ncbi:MAG: DUF3291 domain-containing protein [Actinoallomurus sp.]
MVEPYIVIWWVSVGHLPSPEEALDRLERVRREGPGPEAFTFGQSYDPAGALVNS